MQTKSIERYFFFGLLFLALLFAVMIFRPFLGVIAIGASLAVALYPVYKWLAKKMPGTLAAVLVVIMLIIGIGGPLFGMGAIVVQQSQDMYTSVTEGGNAGTFMYTLGDYVNKYLPEGFMFDVDKQVTQLIAFISQNIGGSIAQIFSTTLSTVFSVLLALLTVFYFLKDGARWKRAVVILSPLSDKDDEKILDRLGNAVNAVIKGYLLIAVAQGILMGIGLAIFGVPNPALWGVVAGVASLVPMIGTALVAIPAILFLFITGDTGSAIGLAIWATALVGTVDNFLSPMLIGSKTHIPPLLVLFSVLGGIALMGPIGILVGPLSLSLLRALISLYQSEFKHERIPLSEQTL